MGAIATSIWMVEQFGLEIIAPGGRSTSRSPLISGTTNGISSSRLNADVLSITVQPASAARGACTRLTLAPAENNAKSVPVKSKSSSTSTSILRFPNSTVLPSEFSLANAWTSAPAKPHSTSMDNMASPTAPVAPATAIFSLLFIVLYVPFYPFCARCRMT